MPGAANDTSEMLVTLTSDIVAEHVSNNSVAVEDVPRLIANIYGALAGLGQEASVEALLPEPAVSVRSSVKPDSITCLECGRKMKVLKRHLSNDHELTPDGYRQRWSLPTSYPLIAPNYAEKRREIAKQIGLGRKPGQKRGRRKKIAA